MNRASSLADASGPLAVLVSGGLDSAMLPESVPFHTAVIPLYVRFGLFWEEVELEHLHHILQAIAPGVDLLLHPSAGGAALRRVQQVCGAAEGLCNRSAAGPHRVRKELSCLASRAS